jgi:hypothetical protein
MLGGGDAEVVSLLPMPTPEPGRIEELGKPDANWYSDEFSLRSLVEEGISGILSWDNWDNEDVCVDIGGVLGFWFRNSSTDWLRSSFLLYVRMEVLEDLPRIVGSRLEKRCGRI